MKEHDHELNHLQASQISKHKVEIALQPNDFASLLFPPEVFLNLRPKGGQKVVEVHHCVNPGVKKCSEPTLSSTNKSRAPPAIERHDAVMEYMEKGQVAGLFLQQKYDRVDHVNDF